MTAVGLELSVLGMTSARLPSSSERAQPLTMGAAEEPASTTGIQVPSAS